MTFKKRGPYRRSMAREIAEYSQKHPEATVKYIADVFDTSDSYVRKVKQRHNLSIGVSTRIGGKSVRVPLNKGNREKLDRLAAQQGMTAAKCAAYLLSEILSFKP